MPSVVATRTLLIVTTLAFLCLTMSVEAKAEQWDTAVRLNTVEGWFPDVVVGVNGEPHVLWSSGPGRGCDDAVLHCAPSPSGCTEITRIVERPDSSEVYCTRPAGAIDRDGVLHLLWRRKNGLAYTSAPVTQLNARESWNKAQQLGECSYTALAIDPQGSLHAAWSQWVHSYPGGPCEDAPCYGCADIFYRRSDDGGRSWTAPVNLSQTREGSEKPQITIAADGALFVAWDEGRDHYAGKGQARASMLTSSTDRGQTWSAPVSFTYPNDTPQSIALGIDGSQRVIVVWQLMKGSDVFYQVSDDRGRTWTSAQPIAGVRRRAMVNNLDDYAMSADARGHLHLVLSGRLDDGNGQNHVVHVEWDGAQWGTPESIFATAGAPEWPRIAIGKGDQLHVAWFERPVGFEWRPDGKNYAVWYAHGVANAAPSDDTPAKVKR